MSDSSTDPNVVRPPVASFEDPSIRGTRCQDQTALDDRTVKATHDGCPGWWAGLENEAGFSCGCECHNKSGWPGWVSHLAQAD